MLPMIPYFLAYCESLLFSPVGIVMFSSNQTIHRYMCNLIGGDELFIVRYDSDLLLSDVVICPTIGGGSFHLHCIVML